MNDWIDVRDRLPRDRPRSRPLLVCYRNGHKKHPLAVVPRKQRVVCLAVYSGGAWRFINEHDKTRLSERVTHWMPMPRLPSATGARTNPKPSGQVSQASRLAPDGQLGPLGRRARDQ